MSQYADTSAVLPEMLKKYPKENHVAIIETFAESLDGNWPEEDVKHFFEGGLGFSKEADEKIKYEAGCWGIAL